MQAILGIVGTTLLSMLTKMLTEAFFRKLIVLLLEMLVKRTATDLDDKLLIEAKKAWNVDNEEEKR